MALRIEQDHSRFKQIVRGRIRKNLKKYISSGELIGRKGRDLISIPVPQIDLPQFIHGPNQGGGVGQGEGEVGQVVGTGEGEGEEGQGKAGDAPGAHILEVDVTLEELAQILGEELELPAIKAKGKKNIVADKEKYSGISNVGPEGLRHFKRTYREALKRQIASGTYDPFSPKVVPIRRDRRYRSWKVQAQPETNAVIIYMMDVSGSMGDEQKEIVRIESFWLDTWLRNQYNGIEVRYIIHDAEARQVDRETFYYTRESGGTVISSAYKLCDQLIMEEFPPEAWNIYLFHFSDGDNWSQGDTEECIRLMRESLLEKSNLFCYGQVESPYGTGQFLQDLKDTFSEDERVALSQIENKEAIHASIKEFLGRGR
jgi:sporulation protein YhbH